MDLMVLSVQAWVNSEYTGKSGYTPIAQDGITGGTTNAALITALQIEMGIQSPNGFFGPATESACPTIPSASASKNEIYILQGALYCKGYNPNGLDGGYGNGIMTAIKKFQSDAGLTTQDGITTPMIFKALLNTDAFVLISGGDSKIRTIQQNLNRDYNSVIGLMPCEGIYSRSTNVALIKALQHEQGNSPDGFWGANTMKACPTIPGSNSTQKFMLLLQYALYCNGYDPKGFDGLFGQGFQTAIIDFQKFSCLTADGYAGGQTWASLLVSTGDNTRKGTACDCSTTITVEKAQSIKSNGYKMVGRYLTGMFKMTCSEINIILNAGLNIFPIYETGGNKLSYFTKSQGTTDAYNATSAAKSLGFPDNTIIYFTVDFDALAGDVTTSILPYFEAIRDAMTGISPYRIGIYAPRNVCSSVAAKGYSCSSYVCDMSSGFSGNLGYSLPSDWAIDQISTITIGTGAGQIEIDNNICSGKDLGVSSVNPGDPDLWTPNSTLATVVSAAGFLYDPSQDSIYSRLDPLQRDYGYCNLYDESAAPLMSTIVDCEPIYFTYDDKDWLIEFWKGQYGLETGAEIGIYNRDSDSFDARDILMGKYFKCVSDIERLNMSFVLKRDGVELFRRGPELHWWLTGFKWGEFTDNPSQDLTMTVIITLKNSNMRTAFLQGLKDRGYTEYNVDGNTVTFTFGVPKSQQPVTKLLLFDSVQAANKSIVADYNLIKNELALTSNDPNLIEESVIQELSTELQDTYNRIVNWFNSIISVLDNLNL